MLDARGSGVPHVVHWGCDLGELASAQLAAVADAFIPAVSPSSIDSPMIVDLLPVASTGWSGRPGLTGARGRAISYPSFELAGVETDGSHATFQLTDATAGLSVQIAIGFGVGGVLEVANSVTNTGQTDWTLGSLVATLPLPHRADELLDFGGRWASERRPHRRSIRDDGWSRQTRHGRTGHDSPYLAIAGRAGFGFREGDVWSMHLAWSGDQDVFVDTLPTGHHTFGAGELLQPGEIVLSPGETYAAPALLAAHSDSGIDGLSARYHAWARALRPLGPRPLTLNTWEAVYFDHSAERLVELADTAARVGVERFVLDDGWMTARIDDQRALGDWTVDPVRWPEGLHPLVDHVVKLGMEFGLWVEPEMVSLDSDLARRHPEWILRGDGDRLPEMWRHQYAVDLDNEDAWTNIFEQLCALLDEYPIAYLKWDQNRDLLGGSTARQTRATWRLMAALRSRYPGLEIESCSSGGARVDLGILEHVDRFWPSDTNDPLERQQIQRWTGILMPPEFLGSHLGAAKAHTTGRTSDLGFRLATALFLSAGIEWDLGEASPAELDVVAEWAALYTQLRPLLHGGTTVRMDPVDDAIQLHGVVSPDRGEAVFALVCLDLPRDAVFAPLRFAGLDPEREYRVETLNVAGPARRIEDLPAPWMPGPVVLNGRALEQVGLAAPALAPGQAQLFRLGAVPVVE